MLICFRFHLSISQSYCWLWADLIHTSSDVWHGRLPTAWLTVSLHEGGFQVSNKNTLVHCNIYSRYFQMYSRYSPFPHHKKVSRGTGLIWLIWVPCCAQSLALPASASCPSATSAWSSGTGRHSLSLRRGFHGKRRTDYIYICQKRSWGVSQKEKTQSW